MFKRFTPEESISSISQVKNSIQRQIHAKIIEQYPKLEEAIDVILPKKLLVVGKGQDNIQLIIVNNEVLFYNQRDGPFMPTLKLLHKYPTMMKSLQVDKGAIRFILGGANLMCPGFTSAGGSLPDVCIQVGEPVAIFAEGKINACAIGILTMSTDDIKSINKGMAVETAHFLNDGLWQTKTL